ncbi:ABC transporter substrate-binding protein [Niveispirillum sp.]|uniref:ABC transporter substrate-binding protein n=1 Tax=Niveispirillum sp. TaxID=1917217 RepID=UPI001B5DD1C3|nr:ABC transporter substrate-binding protein [Niveispirillum sp.]MBP7338296.1 ABC transporter substrate-binding protein [Niveispirillum sp.]
MERQARTGYGVAVLLILSGCALFVAGAWSIVPSPVRPLAIGTNLWIGYEPFHLARAAGTLPADVTLVEARSSPALMEAVASGSLDGAALTLDEVMRLEAAGRPMAVLAVLDISNGADVVLARDAAAVARGPAGARIGVETEGVGSFVLYRFLERHGLTLGQVQVQPVSVGDHADALRRLDLDYIVSYEPLVSHLEQAGAVRVFDSADMAGEVVDVLAVRRDRLAGRRATLYRLLAAWYGGVDGLTRGDALAIQRVGRRQHLSDAQVRQVLARLDFPNAATSRAMLSAHAPAVTQAQRWLVASGEVGRAPDPVLDPSYLPE